MIQQRNTVQKKQVFAALTQLANHPTAEQVYQLVAVDHPNISRATVYRILNNMARDGKILRVPVPDGADHFDHQVHPHYHIKCTGCGKVYDINMPTLPDLNAKAQQYESDIEINGHTIMFYGVCPCCKS